eukprot:CAMPEP_0170428136 /NCGR_PEP_ID=MMETSP0117_2-20130122/39606_1 /TAXON_ID=400756 /ORGANISM="Durinskia baltica, Strain CSIRO CS-38" /LENGTH=248 /DNA_ID=CAMNT_0010687403 /DNA_START=62 /DNA_END=808 /DNA_ORIENTATION=-
MEKKSGFDNSDSQQRSRRRETSERKGDEADSKGNDGGDAPVPKNRRKRAGGDENGWMTSGGGTTGSRHAVAVPVPIEDDEPKDSQAISANRDKHLQDDNDEIILIPDLDEEGGADSDQRIAHAPRNVNRKIPTLKDLEVEVKAAVPTSEEGLNLSVLLTTLVPAGMVKEDDVVWTFDSLLREITDELSNTPKTVVEVVVPSAGASSGKAGASVSAAAPPSPTPPEGERLKPKPSKSRMLEGGNNKSKK